MRIYLAIFLLISSTLLGVEKLRVYDENHPEEIIYQTSDHTEIQTALNTIGVQFEKWEADRPLTDRPTEDEIFDAFETDIVRLMVQNNYRTVDVIRMFPENPLKTELRTKFLREHTHEEDEVRLFVEGNGLFYLHIEDKVFIVLCEKGELISIPAHYRHWFDMGESPYFIALRFFIDPSGWVAHFTGSDIADIFPLHEATVAAILTDIEGTTTSISFVKDVLFPYARKAIPEFVERHRHKLGTLIDEVKNIADVEDDQVVETLLKWMDADQKIGPLKALQGMIWEEGYRSGVLQGHIYEDAVEQLNAWKEKGVDLYVYSSGSVQAQELLFTYSCFGNLAPLFSGYFDTRTGAKKEVDSYRKIAEAIGVEPRNILFLSDSPDELKAARAAGMNTRAVVREETPCEVQTFTVIHNFKDLELP